MALAPGSKLGVYEIVEKIGAGGMGEVYRARDPRVGRDVAIKVSAEKFSERFEREARTIASLNHPNICTLYDVGPDYLVMELIEGESPEGPLPLETVLHYARQIADALEAAHDKGVVHRDLKPGNIKITSSGLVKVLDFGLAKTAALTQAPSENSPTLSMDETKAGVILGTAAYMSPEQAKGRTVDKRADIWAFGVVLYEMLTGKRLFAGETLQETLAGVLKEEPKLDRAPAQVRFLLSRCLEKDPKRRLRDIGDAMSLVQVALPKQTDGGPRVRLLPWVAAAVFALAAGIAVWAPWRVPPAAESTRFQILAPENNGFGIYLVFSPDGRKLAFTAQGKDGRTRIWVRDMNAASPRLLPGTEIASGFGSPFWSPDSRYVAFGDGNKLKKVDSAGNAPPVTMAEVSGTVGQGSWSKEGVILFGGRGDSSPIRRVPDTGGEATPVTLVDRKTKETFHGFPFFLPDGKHFLYFRVANPDRQGVYIGSLDAKPDQQPAQRLIAVNYNAIYVPSLASGSGSILFLRDGTLFAQPFDAGQLKLAGDAVPIAEQVGSSNTYGFFSASANGNLAFRAGSGQTGGQLTWFDRQGKELGQVGERGLGTGRISPDGARLAAGRLENGNTDLWLVEFARGVSSRFTFDRAEETNPVWSPDGKFIVFRSNAAGQFDLYRKAANGTGETEAVVISDKTKWADDWSHNGKYLSYEELDAEGKEDLWFTPMEGGGKPSVWFKTPFREFAARFSPDDRWIAYQSDETGRYEVYVQPFTPPGSPATSPGGKWQVSRDGGQLPQWRKDGKELVFLGANRTIMTVDVTTTPAFQTSSPRPLFQIGAGTSNFTARDDLQQFLIPVPVDGGTPSPVTVVMNWQSELKK